MPTKRYRPEEIVSKLRQVDVLSRFAQLAPRMLSSPARFRRGMPDTPSVGWATQACLASIHKTENGHDRHDSPDPLRLGLRAAADRLPAAPRAGHRRQRRGDEE